MTWKVSETAQYQLFERARWLKPASNKIEFETPPENVVYMCKNVLPSTIQRCKGKQNLNSSKSSCDIVNKEGKIVYEQYKYDLNDLFNQTPTFYEPNVAFKAKQSQNDSLWGKVADFVLSPDNENVHYYMQGYTPFNEDLKRYKNLPFLFKRISDNLVKHTSIRRSRRTGVNLQGLSSMPTSLVLRKIQKGVTSPSNILF